MGCAPTNPRYAQDAGRGCVKRPRTSQEFAGVRWIGEARINSRYNAVQVAERVVLHVGECVRLRKDGDTLDSLARIMDFWETQDGNCFAEVSWVLFPEQTQGGRKPTHHPFEVFETPHIGTIPVETFKHSVNIMTHEEFMRCESAGLSPEVDFFSRMLYHVDSNEFKLLANRPVVNEGSVHDRAIARLQLSAMINCHPCRDNEHQQIKNFVKTAVQRGVGDCLYVAGMPGTGKTSTFMQVVRELKRESDHGILPPFEFIELNGMKLPDPAKSYAFLWHALTGSHVSMKSAAMHLEEHFSNRTKPCVLLVDEVDRLLTKNQRILYNIFDWSRRHGSKLAVVAISNTVDLPTQFIPRVQSRLGLSSVIFSAYNRAQLLEILDSRLQGLDVFHRDALDLCTRKVASVSGDVRRALHLCKRAVEMFTPQAITIDRMLAAFRDAFGGGFLEMMSALCLHDKVLLKAILMLSSHGNVRFERLLGVYEGLCRRLNIKGDWRVAESAVQRFVDLGLLSGIREHKWSGLCAFIQPPQLTRTCAQGTIPGVQAQPGAR